jgi:hypothetical protein
LIKLLALVSESPITNVNQFSWTFPSPQLTDKQGLHGRAADVEVLRNNLGTGKLIFDSNFNRRSPKIASGLLTLGLSSHDASPSLKRRTRHFMVGNDRAVTPSVPREWT